MTNTSFWFVSYRGEIDRAMGSREWCAKQYMGWLGPFPTRSEALEVARKRKARVPQDFDCSPLPLFGDSHKQKEMF